MPNRRTKLYELEDQFHCSIIGTCLTLKELRQLYRKIKFIPQPNLTDYELHRIFVGIAGESDYANRKLQKHLDQKYRHIVKQFAKLQSASDLKTMWQNALDSGEVAGTYWALVTHPCVPNELLDEVFGEIHMLSHLSGASIRVDMQKLSVLRQRTKVLEKQLADAFVDRQKRLKEKDQTIHALKKRLTIAERAESQLQALQTQQEALEKDSLIKQLRKQIKELTVEQERVKRIEKEAENWKSFALRTEDRNLSLEQRLAQTVQERDSLEASLSSILGEACPESCTADCPNMDLRGRCILFVGGHPSQCSHFRHLVEQYNGRFIHHDGGREDGHFKLGSNLSQADAVLCPLDAISHDAMNWIKQHCEYNSKQLVMMPRSSLSAFVKGLKDVRGRQFPAL